jgi:hypothetical protein
MVGYGVRGSNVHMSTGWYGDVVARGGWGGAFWSGVALVVYVCSVSPDVWPPGGGI